MKYLPLFLCFFIVSTVAILTVIMVANADNNTFKIWVTSDVEADETTGPKPDWWHDAVNDSNNFDWDICIMLGDLADIPYEYSYKDYMDWRNDSNKDREYFYNMPGNHEGQVVGGDYLANWTKYIDPLGENPSTSFVNNSNRPFQIIDATQGYLWGDGNASPNDGQMRYAVKAHNIILLLMGPDIDNPSSSCTSYPYFNWWKSHIESYSNDNIIITCTHHPLANSGLYKESAAVDQSTSYENYLDANNSMLCDIWLNGHYHWVPSQTPRLVYNTQSNSGGKTINTTFFNIASVTGDHDKGSVSYLFTFTNGSNKVIVWQRDHVHQCWNDSSPYNTTLNLSTAFIMESESPENNTINDTENFGISLPIDYTATPTPPHHDSDMEYFGISIPISYLADNNSSGFVIQHSNIPYLTIAGLAVFFPILGLLIYKEKRR